MSLQLSETHKRPAKQLYLVPVTSLQAAAGSSPCWLQVLNLLAGGREVSNTVSLTCQSILARPANAPSKRLAYDIAKTAALSSEDWDAVYEGLRTDTAGAHTPEVC